MRFKHFIGPVVIAAATVLSATHLQDLVDAAKRALGESFPTVLAGVLVSSAVATALFAVREIRSERRLRWGLILLAFLLVAAYVGLSDRGNASERALERLHFVIYGGMAALFYGSYSKSLSRIAASSAALMTASSVGVIDEWLQFRLANRTGELFDLILNLYGGVIGTLAGLALFWSTSARDSHGGRKLGILLAIAASALSVGFLADAHAGHWIQDDEIGRFRSWFSRAGLEEKNQLRSPEWQPPGAPDLDFDPWDWQDTFLIEGGYHVMLRGAAQAERDWETAWRENRILEKYFEAMMIVEIGGRPYYRWSEQHRSNVRGELVRAGKLPLSADYTSTVGEGRIFPGLAIWQLLVICPLVWIGSALPMLWPRSRAA